MSPIICCHITFKNATTYTSSQKLLNKSAMHAVIVGWKPILYWLFGPKSQSFRNKSGKTQPIRTKFGIRGNVKGWQRSGNFGHDRPILGKIGWGESNRVWVFLCDNPRDLSATSQWLIFYQIWSQNVLRCPVEESGKIFSEIFTFGSFAPKIWNRKSVKQAPHSEQATGHGMHCREILFTPRCTLGAREFPRSVNFSLRRTVADLRGVKVAQFSDFGLFSPYKAPKTYLPVTSLQPMGYIAEWLRFFRVVVEGPKGCFPAAQFSCDFL